MPIHKPSEFNLHSESGIPPAPERPEHDFNRDYELEIVKEVPVDPADLARQNRNLEKGILDGEEFDPFAPPKKKRERGQA